MDQRKCCYLEGGTSDGKPCGAPAEWELYGSNHPIEHTDACTAHVGALLDDSPVTNVYPITPNPHR